MGGGNVSVTPMLASDYSLLNYSIGIGSGSAAGDFEGWTYVAPEDDILGGAQDLTPRDQILTLVHLKMH